MKSINHPIDNLYLKISNSCHAEIRRNIENRIIMIRHVLSLYSQLRSPNETIQNELHKIQNPTN